MKEKNNLFISKLDKNEGSYIPSSPNEINLSDINILSPEFKKSELYHLQAISIACRFINRKSPYINHLIATYKSNYNENLENPVIHILIIYLDK